MAVPQMSPAQLLKQLEGARLTALQSPEVYNQFIPGFTSLVQQNPDRDIRRWGADFVAEAFSQPLMPSAQKEELLNSVVPFLRHLLEAQPIDVPIVRSAIQAAASIYPLVFRRVSQKPEQVQLWQDMTAVKLNIISRMDSFPAPLRIMCIKFVQKVVQVQTPGVISDPRRPEQHDISLAIVRRNHPLLPLINLEAETSGLVDRLLAVLQEQSSDPLIIDATMNCLAVLIKTRPVIQNKILAAVLNYNPFRLANTPITPRVMVVMRSLERTTRALLKFVTRILPQHPMREKIDLYINRLQETRLVVLSGKPAQKRPAEPNDGLDNVKRQKLEQGVQIFPPMPPPPHTLAQVFTLTDDKALAAFDAKVLPEYLVTQIAAALMQHIDSKTMDLAVEEVRQRFVMIREMARALPVEGAMPAGTEEEEYDPEALNAATETSTAPIAIEPPSLPALELETFELPRPAPMTDLEVNLLSDMTVSRLFATALENDRPAPGRLEKPKQGINRLAANANDRDSWLITMIRLAARAPAGLERLAELSSKSDKEEDGSDTPDEGEIEDRQVNLRVSPVATRIRDSIFKYILDDWHARLPLAVTWLTEEWYADRIAAVGLSNGATATTQADASTPTYELWAQRLLEYILPRIDATDHKHLVRTVSELPCISRSMLRQMKVLFRDPATLKIGNMALQYLYLMRPPTRDVVVDTMQEIWEEGDEEQKAIAAKALAKWRPGFDAQERAVQQMKSEIKASRTFSHGMKAEEVGRSTTGTPISVAVEQ